MDKERISADAEPPPATLDPSLRPLFGELGDLKRVRSAGREGSIASRLFQQSWAELVAGVDPGTLAYAITGRALAAARLGDIDGNTMLAAGMAPDEAAAVLCAAVEDVGEGLEPAQRRRLAEAASMPFGPAAERLPAFVAALQAQPRAGVTCPGKPRIILEPPENHAEHCLMVAVYGVLLSPRYGARPETVFLAAIAHHFHNAGLPDSGFTGEMLLGPHLLPVMEHFTRAALAELAAPLRRQVEEARSILPDAATPEGRAFHAADTIDRVMQIAQHLTAATLTMDRVLGEMALVHDGPVKGFQDRVLAEMGLP